VDRPDVLLAGGVTGYLDIRTGCVQIRSGRRNLTPVWPGGTTITRMGGGFQISLPDSRGTVRMPSKVRVSGAIFATEESAKLSSSLPSECSKALFAVSRIE
jgi:hypothetical protein